MSQFDANQTVGEIVSRHPHLSRVFETVGVDYCCGGKKSLQEACTRKGLDSGQLLKQLSEAEEHSSKVQDEVDPAKMTLTQLADHIEATHHTYLRSELPRLDRLTQKVAAVHGDRDPRLAELRETFQHLAEELSLHMMKEERVLFPMIREIESSETAPQFHCGSLANPIGQMELEHDGAGSALERQRTLTDSYQPPEWACNTYRAMVDALDRLEKDLHLHIHKENNILFPGALEMEGRKAKLA